MGCVCDVICSSYWWGDRAVWRCKREQVAGRITREANLGAGWQPDLA
jgi:hypothetical protein